MEKNIKAEVDDTELDRDKNPELNDKDLEKVSGGRAKIGISDDSI